VLRLVEREAQWIEASITNWRIAAEEAECRTLGHKPEPFERVNIPELAVTDRATIAAHLAAFGSDNVRRFSHAWRGTIAAIENEKENLTAEARLSYPEGPYISQWSELRALQPNELGARQALAYAIAEELGHEIWEDHPPRPYPPPEPDPALTSHRFERAASVAGRCWWVFGHGAAGLLP
jgi:hypothetical protein